MGPDNGLGNKIILESQWHLQISEKEKNDFVFWNGC